MNYNEEADLDSASQLLVQKEILACQSMLVEEMLKTTMVSYDDIANLWDEETEEAQEIFEWWLIVERLAKDLEEEGEPILRSDYGTWWGRTCTGQAIYMDGIIRKIAEKYFM